MSTLPVVEVAAAIIQKDGKFLITQRKPEEHLAGFWEFPGGKREESETFEECLVREVREELGIQIAVRSFVNSYQYEYPERTVRLFFYLCDLLEGKPRAQEVARFRWVEARGIGNYKFPPADREIIERIRKGQIEG